TQFSNFNQFVTTGESSIFFCSPYIYGVLSERGCLAKLKDVLGHEVDSSADGYGVALKDTALYLDEPVLAFLPEDTVVCMMVPFAWGSSAKEEYYANAKEMFRTIVEGTK
ncbi:MAG: hypothetical protein MJ078_07060, partial [Clostridia bacterium]|nr:hypothetical protein [Clostridia bacterium]